jgi:phospholipid-binding lipoprotein MlaA
MNMLHRARIFGAFVIALAASGCASTPMPDSVDQNDPYESFNRQVFSMNMSLDNNVALPVAKFYVRAVPEPARDGVHNFLSNLGEPQTFANDVLQGEVTRAATTLGRFTINTTIGVGGLVDAATKFGIDGHTTDFGETLAVYGADEGPYLVSARTGPQQSARRRRLSGGCRAGSDDLHHLPQQRLLDARARGAPRRRRARAQHRHDRRA